MAEMEEMIKMFAEMMSKQQSMAKSTLPTEAALREFLMQYRRTPFSTGLSPNQLLHGMQIQTKIDTLHPILKRKKREENYNKSKSVLDTVPTKMAIQGKSLGPSPNLIQGIQSPNQPRLKIVKCFSTRYLSQEDRNVCVISLPTNFSLLGRLLELDFRIRQGVDQFLTNVTVAAQSMREDDAQQVINNVISAQTKLVLRMCISCNMP
ncbi:hypothetical protein HELRODRAFT_182788 [Helobdella robusta]|uniref:Uncharacterized protein n=1 Tax=Helobdella robusta TaxID=6412 RepID=T1FIQ6_HELRO|nr:hypothetical protein HELRODRAFT_182788 [Helobdella robusta]ESN90094.1 hypothetical protein HELRODRAFT_182788 [Helobdella robusta]